MKEEEKNLKKLSLKKSMEEEMIEEELEEEMVEEIKPWKKSLRRKKKML